MKSTRKPQLKESFIAICNQHGCKFEFNFMDDDSVQLGKSVAGLTLITDEEGYSWVEGHDNRYLAEIIEKSQNKYHLLINGNSYFFSVETPFSYKRKKFLSKLKQGNKLIRVPSPMPGKVIEVLVNEGDQIAAGDSLLILEAMKMQNDIRSEASGKVVKVHAKAGQNVMKEEILLELMKS
jgi:glutaconyl-CoA/methylmalonyl-CoA decarboxylase subunit gamma